jgi:hypothetical protein
MAALLSATANPAFAWDLKYDSLFQRFEFG